MGRKTQEAAAGKVRGWLIDKRKKLGLSQGQVAAAAGISQPSYCDIENGVTKNPKPETAMKIGAFIDEPWVKFFVEETEE